MASVGDDDPLRLGEQLAEPDADRRAEAAERLAQAAELAAAAAVPLVRACRDEDERVREWAVEALENLGPPRADVVGELAGLVGSPEPLVGYWAATLLGRAGKDGAIGVPALIACVESRADLSVRQRAAWSLGRIGPAAKAARPALERAAGDSDERLARLASEALESLGP